MLDLADEAVRAPGRLGLRIVRNQALVHARDPLALRRRNSRRRCSCPTSSSSPGHVEAHVRRRFYLCLRRAPPTRSLSRVCKHLEVVVSGARRLLRLSWLFIFRTQSLPRCTGLAGERRSERDFCVLKVARIQSAQRLVQRFARRTLTPSAMRRSSDTELKRTTNAFLFEPIRQPSLARASSPPGIGPLCSRRTSPCPDP